MQVVFDKTPIDNCWSSRPRPFMREVNTATVVARHTQDHSCVARPFVSGLAFVTDDSAKKCSKMQHILLIMDSLGATTPWLTFLESSRRADVKLQLTCNAPTYRFRDIRGEMAKIGVGEVENGPHEPISWPRMWWLLKISPPFLWIFAVKFAWIVCE